MKSTLKEVVGELARPIAIISTSIAAAIATVRIAWNVTDGNAGAVYIAAVFAGVAALYGAKSWEVARAGKAAADVAIAQASSPTPAPGTAQITAAADVDVTVREAEPRSLEDPA